MLIFTFMPFSFAQNASNANGLEPTFVVKNFEVTEYGGPIYTMREKALSKAKKEGLSKLLKQITPRKTWGAHAQILKYADIDDLFYKAVVGSESITNRYTASIHLFYKQKQVKSLLAKYGVPYSKNTGGKVLIIPVYEYENNPVLWGASNPLKTSLERTIKPSSFFDFVLPVGKKNEVNSLSAKLAVLGAGDLIKALAESYEAAYSTVIHAKISSRYGAFYLDVTASWFEENVLIEPVIYSAPIDGLVLLDGYPDADKLTTYLDTAMTEILSKIGEHKKNENLVEVDKPGRVFLRFKPQNPSDLEKLQNTIQSMNVVKEFKLRVLNVKDSVFQVDYYGERNAFRDLLESKGFNLNETSMPMVWKISFKNDPFLGPVNYGLEEVSED